MSGTIRTFVKEVENELEWLKRRPKAITGAKSFVPSCLSLYGCLPSAQLPLPPPLPRLYRDESDKRPVSEIIGSDISLQAHNRRRRKLVSCHPSLVVFGDDAESDTIYLVGKEYHSLTNVIAAQAKDLQALQSLLGTPEPAPPFYYIGSYFVPRCKAWQCALHQAATPTKSPTNTEERAFASIAWSKAEPLSIPPICSCRESLRIQTWVKALLESVVETGIPLPDNTAESTNVTDAVPPDSVGNVRATPDSDAVMDTVPNSPVIESPPATLPAPVSDQLEDLEKTLLYEGKACKSCGGLGYFPFSFIEVFLHSHMLNLNEFHATFPDLPPNTDVVCDGPHISVTICCKSPSHELECFRVLSQKRLTRAPIIYDVCSQSFIPGVPTRPGQKRGHEQVVPYRATPSYLDFFRSQDSSEMAEKAAFLLSCDPLPFDSPLQPPPQKFLNCSKVVSSHIDFQTITGLTARRPYCLSVRKDVDLLLVSEALRQPDSEPHVNEEMVSLLRTYAETKKKAKMLDRDIDTLQVDCLSIEVCTPWNIKLSGD